MMKIKNMFLKRSNRLLQFFLTILGFGAVCSLGSCEYGSPAVEYGTPHAIFKVNGTVSSETTSEGISGIQVKLENQTAFTNDSGYYEIETGAFPEDQTFSLVFQDIDDDANGEFQTLDTTAIFLDPEFTGKVENWYMGETQKEINIELKDKE